MPMFVKLAWGNVLRSLRDFTIYFITIVIAIVLFYGFNCLINKDLIAQFSVLAVRFGDIAQTMIRAVSIVLSAVVSYLVISVNLFVVKRRFREFATYLLIGMRKTHLIRIVIVENFICMAAALVVGLAFGVLFSQFVNSYITTTLDLPLDSSMFYISWDALLFTVLVFGAIFLASSLISAICISKFKLIVLFKNSFVTERFKLRNPYILFVLCIMSFVGIWHSYNILAACAQHGFDENEFLLATGLVAISSALCCFSLSGFVVTVVRSIKPLYTKGLCCYVVRQFANSVNSTWLTLTMVTATIFIALSSLTIGLGIVSSFNKDMATLNNSTNLVSVSASVNYDEAPAAAGAGAAASSSGAGGASAAAPSVAAPSTVQASAQTYNLNHYLVEHLPHWTDYVDKTAELHYYLRLGANDEQLEWKQLLSQPAAHIDASEVAGVMTEIGRHHVSFYKLSDVNAALRLHNEEELTLKPNEIAFVTENAARYDAYQRVAAQKPRFSIGSHQLTLTGSMTPERAALLRRIQDFSDGCIVPDALIDAQVKPYFVTLQGYLSDASKQGQIAFMHDVADNTQLMDAFKAHINEPWGNIDVASMYQIFVIGNLSKSLGSLMSVYTGLVLLVAAGCLLALRELTAAISTREHMRKLLQLGATRAQCARALFAQVAVYFFVPAALAASHALCVNTVFTSSLPSIGKSSDFMLLVAGVMTCGYILYFVITYALAHAMCFRHCAQR